MRAKASLSVFVVILLVCFTGCLGAVGERPTFEDARREAGFERATGAMDAETAAAFEERVTAGGEPTARGKALLDRLLAVEEVWVDRRDAVALSIARGEADAGTVAAMDRVLASPEPVQRTVFASGVADATGNGLLDGEKRLFGLDPATPHPAVAELALALGEDGYDSTEIEYVERTGEFSDGTVPPAVVRHLAADGVDPTDLAYLDRVADLPADAFLQAQVGAAAAAGNATEADLQRLTDESGDGLLTAGHLVLGPGTSHPRIAALAEGFADGGLDPVERAYLERAAAVRADPFAWRQLQVLDSVALLADASDVTEADLRRLRDSSGDGLLDATAQSFDASPAERHPDLVALLEPLVRGEFGDTERRYVARLQELSRYRDDGTGYEGWSQAADLGLLHGATADGTVTDRQLGMLANSDGDRLLDGTEAEIGTDPERADTSGDGYADHLKWGPMADLGLEVTPAEVDVFVELDTAENVTVPEDGYASLDAIANTFAAEPGGDMVPITLHVRRCRSDLDSVRTLDGMRRQASEHKDITGMGFHYLFVNGGPVAGGDTVYKGYTRWSSAGTSWMVADGDLDDHDLINTIAHELGHALGVHPADFGGIDSREYTGQEYNSVLNYNLNVGVTYSTGEPFDDYEAMADEKFGSSWEDRGTLQRLWEEGADEGALC